MGKLAGLIRKKISNKIIFALLILISFLTAAILFTVVIKLSNDNVKVTKDNLNMVSTSIFQNLRNIMNTGDLDMMRHAENDARSIEGIVRLEIEKSQSLIDLFSSNEVLSKDHYISKAFENKKIQVVEINDDSGHFLRMAKPMIATSECIACHTNQKVGDVVGVIDLMFSLEKADENLENIIENIIITALILGLITLFIIYFIVKTATTPLEGLKMGLNRLLSSTESFSDLKLRIRSNDEIAEVASLFNQYMDKLHDDMINDIKRITDSIVNSQLNIIISTDLEKQEMKTGNKEFLDFFEIESIEEYKEKYGLCICDSFVKKEGFLSSMIGDQFWYEYIQDNPHMTHKAILLKNGKEHIFKVNTGNFTIDDVLYNSSIFTDITELEEIKAQLEDFNKALELKLEEKIEEIETQNAIMAKQEKYVALAEMMDAIAHEWKQPLSVIKVKMDTLALNTEMKNEIGDEVIIDYNNEIQKQITHLTTTIDDFREFFRPTQKGQIIYIDKSLKNIIALLKSVLIQNKVNVEIESEQDLEYCLIETEFKHVIINLVNNAKDAFIENNIENRTILIQTTKTSDTIQIVVTDNAGGIPEEIMEDIFKVNVTTKEEGKGTGIGLYLSYQIIEKIGGSISVTNVEHDNNQKGAQFTIELPLDK